MRRMIYCCALAFLPAFPVPAQESWKEEVIVTTRPATDAEKKQFEINKEESLRLLKVIYTTQNSPAVQDLMKLRMTVAKLSPPPDIAQRTRELLEIADAFRLYGRSAPAARVLISAPKDCMALPRCSECVGGKVLRRGSGKSVAEYVSCFKSNCEAGVLKKEKGPKDSGEYELVFDRALAKEGFQMRLERISAWLTLSEVPESITETRKVSVVSPEKNE